MRTISDREAELLEKRGYMAELRFEVKDGDGTFQKLENFQGHNWILGAEWGDDTDNQVDEATILLRRNIQAHSLAPLMEDSEANLNAAHSYDPLLDYNRECKLSVRIRATDSYDPDGDPDDPAYTLVFHGLIDRVSWATDVVTVECRGLGKILQNLIIFSTSAVLGGDVNDLLPVVETTNDKVEDVIQTMLDDRFGVDTKRLFSKTGTDAVPFKPGAPPSGESPGFVLSPSYMLTQGQSIMEAIVEMTKDFQWPVRYRFNEDIGDFELTLYDPFDDSPTPVHTFDPKDNLSVDEMSTTDEDIVNVVIVQFKLNDGDVDSRLFVSEDATSRSDFGDRVRIIAPPATDAIRTSVEAQVLADLIRDQLKDPKTNLTITVPFFYWAEVHDFMQMDANDIHMSENIVAKVRAHKHTVEAGKSSTQIQLVDGSDFASFQLLRDVRISAREWDGNAQIVLHATRTTDQSIPDNTFTEIDWTAEVIDTLLAFSTVIDAYTFPSNDKWRLTIVLDITYVGHTPTDPVVDIIVGDIGKGSTEVFYSTTSPVAPTGSPDEVKRVMLVQPLHSSTVFEEFTVEVRVQVDGGETVNVSSAIWLIEKY